MVVIVSGGIGSGKSAVCRILAERFSWPVYDADSRVKDLYVSDEKLLDEVESVLNEKFRDGAGRFDRSLLAARIFTDAEALDSVESVVFPVLTRDFEGWKAENADKGFLVLESATILQKPALISLGDYVVVVDAPVRERVRRAMLRDGISEEKVMERMRNQPVMNAVSEGVVPDCVDCLILNDSDMASLEKKVGDLVGMLLKQKC